MKKKKTLSLLALLTPATLIIGIIFFVPFFQLILYSFWGYVKGSLIPNQQFTFENYVRIFSDPYYFEIYLRTAKLSLISTAITLLLAFPLARYISRKPTGAKGFLIALVSLPLIGGAMIQTMGWLAMLLRYGVINGLLMTLGIISEPVDWLGTQTGVIIGLVQSFIPLMVLPIVATLGSMDENLEDAAKSLGASPIRTFFEVVFPLSLPGVISGSLLVFVVNLTMFVTPSILGQGKIQVFGTLVYQSAIQVMNWPFASAYAIFFMAMAAVVAVVIWLILGIIKKLKPSKEIISYE